MKALEGSYNFQESEKKQQNLWKEEGVYNWQKYDNSTNSRENSFVVDTPPPTVSGQLHMGHIFSYTQTDFVVRFQRMSGKNIFYPMGFDDNGLPTERLVEKLKNVKAVNTDRQEFIEICKEVVEAEEEKFKSLFESIALSVDWSLKYQSISKNSCAISQMSFLDLAEKGEVYRREQPVLWDPVDQTALAQADIEDKEKESEMHDITFKDEAGRELIIATTRPELLPACVSLFYHPEDARYSNLKGKFATSPLFGQKIPILADSAVNPEKGTGLVMCCTFGDSTDIMWWQTHGLDMKIILDKTGRIKDSLKFESLDANEIFKSLVGLKVKEARSKILELLREKNLVLKTESVKQVVKCAERSGAPLEIISMPQWFVRTISHKEEMLKRSAELNWHPKTMKIKLDNWINSISWDWCISRQRFFGVPLPVWYSKRKGKEGKVLLASKDQLPVNPIIDLPHGYSREEVIADMDVLDTWATSSVSPQLSSSAINENYAIDFEKHKNLFPFDLRPQAHEILRTWAFYTILKSHLHQNTLPWKNIMISGWCLAEDKTKMSKSKGNIVSPLSLIENYGADCIRYWASTSKLGADTAFSEDLVKIGKKLVNKLWNASKFASIHFENTQIDTRTLRELLEDKIIYHDVDLWIISRMQKTIRLATDAFENFEYADAIRYIEDFFWKDFCDNYLEISKVRCYNAEGLDNKGQISAVTTLYHALLSCIKLFAPVLPHVTDEIYRAIFSDQSLHTRGNWPKSFEAELEQEEKQGQRLVNILDLVRKAKASKNLSMKVPLEAIKFSTDIEFSEDAIKDLKNVTNAISAAQISDINGEMENSEMFKDDDGNIIFIKFSQQL
jgi:valyl-tRNA synthetase